MSIAKTLQIQSTGLEDTYRIAATIGERLKGGELVELIGDLGAGKTAFVRGLAKGLGSLDAVRSPSFTLSNEYRGRNQMTLYHFDFYRIADPGIMREELKELLGDNKTVVAIEWSDIVEDILPSNRLVVEIIATGLDSRTLTLKYSPKLDYLILNKLI